MGDVTWSLAVLGGAFALESGSLLVAVRQTRRAARNRGVESVRQFLEENRDATLLTILVEDTLALISLPIAALALVLAKLTGEPAWDAGGSLVIGAILMGFAVFLANEVRLLLLGRGLSERDAARAMELLAAEPAVRAVKAMRTMYLGPDAVLLGAEVEMRPDLAGHEVTAALARAEKRLTEAIPVLRFVFLEPQGVGTPEPKVAHGHSP
ncbi:MAG: hypothetical protein LC620_08570 [Halobacteriales archaeon]|nr:hypothetical protein [Halobacteriales archaeon]